MPPRVLASGPKPCGANNLGHFKVNLFDRAEIVMEAGKNRCFSGMLELKDKARGKDADPTSPRARVSLLAAHEHLGEKRRYLAGVQAIKSRFFPTYLPEMRLNTTWVKYVIALKTLLLIVRFLTSDSTASR